MDFHITVDLVYLEKRHSFFSVFIFKLLGKAELHRYFCGCEVHGVHDGAYLWPLFISFIECMHIRAVSSGASANGPIFHVFAAPVVFAK